MIRAVSRMRRRWYYWRRMFRASRPFRLVIVWMAMIVTIAGIWRSRGAVAGALYQVFEEYGVAAVGKIMEAWIPATESEEEDGWRWGKTEVFSYLENITTHAESAEDPAYERLLAAEWENQRRLQEEHALEALERENGAYREQHVPDSTANEMPDRELSWDGALKNGGESEQISVGTTEPLTGEVIAMKPSGSVIIREKLADYDYMIQNFYSIHPTTAAGREMVNAEKFLSMDLSMEPDSDQPQILIYHTHSQEAFADYPENPDATIVGVGAYLSELLRKEGYNVIHDTSVYDVIDGALDRSQAYTCALDGISGILQKHPTIQVVLDIHRDGVDENTKLVTEVNGKPTAKIMFFNGTSQTPDGPIEYLPNPNRDANMAFSFQMQLLAAEQYPGFTRKIYLKGLRYNQHVRARTALVEVGAQTNTYAEALNAMEPLAVLVSQVLSGT